MTSEIKTKGVWHTDSRARAAFKYLLFVLKMTTLYCKTRKLSIRDCTSINKDVNKQPSPAAKAFKLLWGHWHAFSDLWLFHLFRLMFLLDHLSMQTSTIVFNCCWSSAESEIQPLDCDRPRGQIPCTPETGHVYRCPCQSTLIFQIEWTKSVITHLATIQQPD